MSQKRLTKAEIADRLGVTAKQIERYVHDGMPCTGTGRARRFPWPECRRWRDDRLRDEAKRSVERTQPRDLNEARARKEAALAEKAELEVAQLRGALIPLDLHADRVEALTVHLAGRCKGLGRWIGDVQRATTQGEAQAVLDRISDDLLRALQGVADEVEEADRDDDEGEDGGVAA